MVINGINDNNECYHLVEVLHQDVDVIQPIDCWREMISCWNSGSVAFGGSQDCMCSAMICAALWDAVPVDCRFWIAIATLWQIQQLRCPRRDQIEFKTVSELSALGEPMDHTLEAFCVKADDLMVRGKVKPLIFCRQVTAALHLWQRLCRFLLQWTTNNMTILARFEWGAHHPKVVSPSYKLVYKPR